MISDPETVASTLRSLPGIKDVDIVHFTPGKELWIVLRDPIDLHRLRTASETLGYAVARRGSLISMLPRSLAEMLWDGIVHVITKRKANGKQEPAARIVKDLVTGDLVYHPIDNDGLEILEEYLKS